METKKLKPFDLEKAKAGAKVVTRDGRDVRIICWDRKGKHYPIVALVGEASEGEECIDLFTDRGTFLDVGSENVLDLFMAPTIVERWVNVYKKENEYYYGRYYGSEEEALENMEYKNAKYIATAKMTWEE